MVAMVLVAHVVTWSWWTTVDEGSDLFEQVAYGLPALRDGRWWTFFTGMFFASQLALYLPVLVGLVLVAVVYERRVGHLRTLVVAIGGQFFGCLLTALFLWPFEGSGWTWAAELGRQLDLGISGALFALLGALTATMHPVWRRRVRITLAAYLVAMVFNVGWLWDVEHLVSFALGLVAGPLLIGRRLGRFHAEFGPRTQRSLVALVVAVSAATAIIEGWYRGNGGPFNSDSAAEHTPGVTLSLIIGSLVVLVFADGLRRGRRTAWIVVTSVLTVSFVGLLTVESSSERTADLVLVGAQLLILLATFRAFTARAPIGSLRLTRRRLLWVVAGLGAYTAVGFVVLRGNFTPRPGWSDMLREFGARLLFTSSDSIDPTTEAARWFLGSIGVVWTGAIVISVVALVYASRRPQPTAQKDARLRELLGRHHSSSIEWMLTWEGIDVWFSDDGGTAIGYQVIGSVALCLADPVGPLDQRQAALEAFDLHCFERGWVPCLFAAGQATADLAPNLGWKTIEVADDSVMLLDNVEFKGKAWQTVRTALNKAGKEDIELVSMKWADCTPVITDQLRAISGEWVSDKALPEMGFTLGTLREAEDPDVRLHLAIGADRTVEGFTSWMPVSENGEVIGWTLDLMRRRDRGFRPVMEFLIAASARLFADEGYRFISLSAAPLARPAGDVGGDEDVLRKLLAFLGDTLEPFYGFRSLLKFKEKFQPEHHALYLVFPDETALAEIGAAIARAYVPGAGVVDWARMGWTLLSPGHNSGGR